MSYFLKALFMSMLYACAAITSENNFFQIPSSIQKTDSKSGKQEKLSLEFLTDVKIIEQSKKVPARFVQLPLSFLAIDSIIKTYNKSYLPKHRFYVGMKDIVEAFNPSDTLLEPRNAFDFLINATKTNNLRAYPKIK